MPSRWSTATAVVPVVHQGELLGALAISKAGNAQLSPTEGKLLSDVGAQAGLVLRNVKLTAELLARLEELRGVAPPARGRPGRGRAAGSSATSTTARSSSSSR